MEKDLETLRQAALLLEAENKKLVDENVKLTRELLEAQGASPEQLGLKLAELERQLANARRRIYGDSTERRHYRKRGKAKGRGKGEGKAEPQRGHGPKPQPKLRQVEEVCELEASGESVCEHCGKPVQELRHRHCTPYTIRRRGEASRCGSRRSGPSTTTPQQ